MRSLLAFIVAACVVGGSVLAWGAAQQAPAASGTGPSTEEVLKAVRTDLQGARTSIIAKNVTLTSEQAAKFWPVFEKYQKEQSAIMDEQLKGLQRYADTAEKLDDAGALALINTHFQRDAQMVALRQRWLGEFQKVLPTKLAIRVMQIDRRVSLVHQLEFASRIPLVH